MKRKSSTYPQSELIEKKTQNNISILQIGIIILLMAGIISASASSLQAEQEIFEGGTFRIDIPSGWQVIQQEGGGEIKEFVFLVPGSEDDFAVADFDYATNINIVVEELASRFTLDEYADIVLMQVESTFNDFYLEERSEVEISTKPGITLRYSGVNEADEDISRQEWFIIHEGTAHVISYTARSELFEEFWEEAELVRDSFELK